MSAGTCEECTCPPGKHKVGCTGQDAGVCQDCPANTFASSVGTRLDGCAPCVTCSTGKFLVGCSSTSGPGICDDCPRGQFLQGGTCRGCCPSRGYRDPDVDCRNVSWLLASGAVASVEALWGDSRAWKSEGGEKQWQFDMNFSTFTVSATTKTPSFSCTPCAMCPAGHHTVQCQGQSAGTCEACAPGSCAQFSGHRLEGCRRKCTCADKVKVDPKTATLTLLVEVVMPYTFAEFDADKQVPHFAFVIHRMHLLTSIDLCLIPADEIQEGLGQGCQDDPREHRYRRYLSICYWRLLQIDIKVRSHHAHHENCRRPRMSRGGACKSNLK